MIAGGGVVCVVGPNFVYSHRGVICSHAQLSIDATSTKNAEIQAGGYHFHGLHFRVRIYREKNGVVVVPESKRCCNLFPRRRPGEGGDLPVGEMGRKKGSRPGMPEPNVSILGSTASSHERRGPGAVANGLDCGGVRENKSKFWLQIVDVPYAATIVIPTNGDLGSILVYSNT